MLFQAGPRGPVGAGAPRRAWTPCTPAHHIHAHTVESTHEQVNACGPKLRMAAAVRQWPPRSLGDGCSLKSWTPSLQGRVPCARIAREPSGTAHEVDQSARECQHGDAVVGGDADHFGECRRGIGAAQGHHDSFSEVEWAAPLIDACQPLASRLFEHGRLISVSKDYLATARVRLRRGAESSSHG